MAAARPKSLSSNRFSISSTFFCSRLTLSREKFSISWIRLCNLWKDSSKFLIRENISEDEPREDTLLSCALPLLRVEIENSLPKSASILSKFSVAFLRMVSRSIDLSQPLSSRMFEFPALRTAAWMNSKAIVDTPSEIFTAIAFDPEFMLNFPSIHLYAKKAEAVRTDIKRTLFKHAIYQIQNVEVQRAECDTPRKLIASINADSRLENYLNDSLMRQEVWTIDRCGVPVQYSVKVYKEGADGFSVKVKPKNFKDKWLQLKFNLDW
jgi:hypothetical protein